MTDHRTAASAPAAGDTADRTIDDGEGPVVKVTQVKDRPGNLGVTWHRVTIDGRTFRSFIDAEEADEVALRLFDEVHRERRSRKAVADTRPVVAGLRELADFLEDHPALPEPSSAWADRWDWNAPRDRDEARGELRTVATILGVAPQIDATFGRVTVSRAFGAEGALVSYEAQWPIDAVTELRHVTAVERRLPADLEDLGAGGEA